MSHQKIGFWSLISVVIGSQIGSGILILPANLAPYGLFAVAGWVLSSIGAIALSLVFAQLASKMPQTGGPHVYVSQAFGKRVGFYTGWTYWTVSWVSSTAVVVASIGYLDPLIGPLSSTQTLLLQFILLWAVIGLNLLGVHMAGRTEFFLTLLKIVPFIILPALAFMHFNSSNISMSSEVQSLPLAKILSQVVLLTLWGFIGLETGTTPAGHVHHAAKTIPRAVIIGTSIVALVYCINSFSILGVVPSDELAGSKAPFATMTQHLLGGDWYLVISAIASLLCIGSLNAWSLTSGQIALGLAEDQLIPRFLGRLNRHHAPYVALLISAVGIMPLLIITTHTSLAAQLALIIDFSVTAFLFVYLISTLAFLKQASGLWQWSYGLVALVFCSWILIETDLATLLVASLFTLSGLLIKLFK